MAAAPGQQRLSNSLAIQNLAHDHERVGIKSHIATAAFLLLAVLAVFVYPLTFGPPAPDQKFLSLASILMHLLMAVCLFMASAARLASFLTDWLEPRAMSPSQRLALVCTRLC